MAGRIVAILLIWVSTTVAWFLLAGTMSHRDKEKGSSNREQVEALWGRKLHQVAPTVRSGAKASTHSVPLTASTLNVDLDLTHRKKGLQWYPTYRVTFEGRYKVQNPTNMPLAAVVYFPLPDEHAVYDEFRFAWGEKVMDDLTLQSGVVRRAVQLAPGAVEEFTVAYTSQGMGEWYYAFGEHAQQVRNFELVMDTNFEAIDFPTTGSSPTKKTRTAEGWRLEWRYGNLLSGVQIGMVMPEKLNPGPWVEQVSRAAPVSLFLFFFLVFITSTLRGVRLHPMNYFFLAAAFFSYHLLLSYLVDHISIHVAFWICSAVSIFLVVSYMRLVVDPRTAVMEVGVCQVIYLVLFSYTFFFKGFTGLAITILCIVTLFVVMQMTGRLDWEALFRGETPGQDEPDPEPPASAEPPESPDGPPLPPPLPVES